MARRDRRRPAPRIETPLDVVRRLRGNPALIETLEQPRTMDELGLSVLQRNRVKLAARLDLRLLFDAAQRVADELVDELGHVVDDTPRLSDAQLERLQHAVALAERADATLAKIKGHRRPVPAAWLASQRRAAKQDRDAALRIGVEIEAELARSIERRATEAGLRARGSLEGLRGGCLTQLKNGGFVRMPTGDGLAKLYRAGKLSDLELRCGLAYRELFVPDPAAMKLSDPSRIGSGGTADAHGVRLRAFDGWSRVLAIRIALSAHDDSADVIRLLDYVCRDGWMLNRVSGDGRAWAQALARLKLGIAVAAPILGVA